MSTAGAQAAIRHFVTVSVRISALLFGSIHPPSMIADRSTIQEPVCQTCPRRGYLDEQVSRVSDANTGIPVPLAPLLLILASPPILLVHHHHDYFPTTPNDKLPIRPLTTTSPSGQTASNPSTTTSSSEILPRHRCHCDQLYLFIRPVITSCLSRTTYSLPPGHGTRYQAAIDLNKYVGTLPRSLPMPFPRTRRR